MSETFRIDSMTDNSEGTVMLERIDTIQRLAVSPLRKYQFKFRGTNIDLPVIRVKIHLPVYRIGNRRTKTLQEEYLVKHPELSENFFKNDTDSIAVQDAQDEILSRLIFEKDMYKAFVNDKYQQEEPLLCTMDGVVINGNRRLCAWRKLFNEDHVRYKHFESIEIMLLPPDTDESDINNIERDLQIKKTYRSEYSWHARANMMKMEQANGNDLDQLAVLFESPKSEIQLALDCYDYAREYLKSIGKPGQWSLVDGEEYAFEKIVNERKRIINPAEQRVFEACAAVLIQSNASEVGDRKYKIIPEVAKNLKFIIPVLKRDILSSDSVNRSTDFTDPLAGVFGNDVEDDVGLLYKLETECRKSQNHVKTIEVIRTVIEDIATRERDQRTSQALLSALTDVSTRLITIKTRNLDDRQEDFAAIRNQLDSILDSYQYISNWVNDHAPQS